MTMLTDDDLEQLLATAASLAPEPVEGPPELGDDEDADERRRWRVPRWLPAAAVVLVALLVGRVVLDDPDDDVVAPAPDETTDGAGQGGESPELGGAPAPTVVGDLDGRNANEVETSAGLPAGAGGSSSAGSGTASAPASGGAQVPGVQPRIIHNGTMELEVEEGGFGPTVDRITALATGLGGHVSATQTTEQGDNPRGTVTVRVPANTFEQLLGEVRGLGEVEAVATTGTDVTAQYTDLEARLNALGATRNQLMTVLSQAEAIPDILAVQDRINVVQIEIESLEGQRRVLEDQSGFGTLAVTVHEPGDPRPQPLVVAADDDDGGLGGAWDEAQRGFGDALEWIVARSGKGLVLAAIALVLYGIGVFTWRRVRRARI